MKRLFVAFILLLLLSLSNACFAQNTNEEGDGFRKLENIIRGKGNSERFVSDLIEEINKTGYIGQFRKHRLSDEEEPVETEEPPKDDYLVYMHKSQSFVTNAFLFLGEVRRKVENYIDKMGMAVLTRYGDQLVLDKRRADLYEDSFLYIKEDGHSNFTLSIIIAFLGVIGSVFVCMGTTVLPVEMEEGYDEYEELQSEQVKVSNEIEKKTVIEVRSTLEAKVTAKTQEELKDISAVPPNFELLENLGKQAIKELSVYVNDLQFKSTYEFFRTAKTDTKASPLEDSIKETERAAGFKCYADEKDIITAIRFSRASNRCGGRNVDKGNPLLTGLDVAAYISISADKKEADPSENKLWTDTWR